MAGNWRDRVPGDDGWDDRVPMDTSSLRLRHVELARAADRSLAALEILTTTARNELRELIEYQDGFGPDGIAAVASRLAEISSMANDRCDLFLRLEISLREVESDRAD